MKRAFTTWLQRIGSAVPSGIGTAILLGAWLGLTVAFTLLGSVLALTVLATLEPTVGPASVLMAVIGISGTPAVSLLLAQVVIAATVDRLEDGVVRGTDSGQGQSRSSSDGAKKCVDCRSSRARCC